MGSKQSKNQAAGARRTRPDTPPTPPDWADANQIPETTGEYNQLRKFGNFTLSEANALTNLPKPAKDIINELFGWRLYKWSYVRINGKPSITVSIDYRILEGGHDPTDSMFTQLWAKELQQLKKQFAKHGWQVIYLPWPPKAIRRNTKALEPRRVDLSAHEQATEPGPTEGYETMFIELPSNPWTDEELADMPGRANN